jgi:hypothetical protein
MGLEACCLVRTPVVLVTSPVSAHRVPPGTESVFRNTRSYTMAQPDGFPECDAGGPVRLRQHIGCTHVLSFQKRQMVYHLPNRAASYFDAPRITTVTDYRGLV